MDVPKKEDQPMGHPEKVWLGLIESRPDLMQHEDARKALRWFQAFVPEDKPGASDAYEKILTYATQQYEGMESAHRTLDLKAYWLFALTSGTLALTVNSLSGEFTNYFHGMALVCFFVAMGYALWVVLPDDISKPMSVEDAMRFVEQADRPLPIIAAGLHVNITRLGLVLHWKSNKIAVIAVLFATGLCFLALGFVIDSYVVEGSA